MPGRIRECGICEISQISTEYMVDTIKASSHEEPNEMT